MPHEFDQAAVAYREAHSHCQVTTGDALATAQDLEAVAVEGLINTPGECLGDIGVKLAALADLLVGWPRCAAPCQHPAGRGQ
jgi:hypothetical protein